MTFILDISLTSSPGAHNFVKNTTSCFQNVIDTNNKATKAPEDRIRPLARSPTSDITKMWVQCWL